MEYIGIDGGVGMVPKGQQGTLFNNTGSHVPPGGVFMQDLATAGMSIEFQQEFGMFALGEFPATAGLDSFPMFICVDKQVDNDRERTRVSSGGVVGIYLTETAGTAGTKVYAKNGTYKATTTAGTNRLIGVTIEAVQASGTPTRCLFYGNTP